MRSCSIVVLCLVLGSGTPASAQDVAVGVKGGVNFANFQFTEDEEDVNFDRRIGFVGGLFVVWPANERFGLQLEALYSQKGAKIDESGFEADFKIDYVDLPVLLRVSTARRGNGAAFHVFGGPLVGIRVRAKGSASFQGQSGSRDISDLLERLDLGLVAGAGVEMGRFIIDGRHTWGMLNINNDPIEEATTKNRVFAAMAGIRF